MVAPNPALQREAQRTLDRLCERHERVYAIHYACQSLRPEERSGSPRITAVAVCRLDGRAVMTASIGAEAEVERLAPMRILAELDALERRLLDKLFAFLAGHPDAEFLHWNMRDAVFGFQAIAHRYSVLGGTPIEIAPRRRFDLALIVQRLYGAGYVVPQTLRQLASDNGILGFDFIPGEAEAEAFERGRYASVERSTLAKAQLLREIARRAHERRLATRAGWWTRNGGGARLLWQRLARLPDLVAKALAPGSGRQPPAPDKVFINYRRDDTLAEASRLHDHLARKLGRRRVFVDFDGIEAGDNFVATLERQLAQSAVMLALIGKDWVEIRNEAGLRRLDNPQDFVRLEIASALAGGVRVIPVLVDAATMPKADHLPPELRELHRRQWYELRNTRFRSDADVLAEKVRACLPGPEPLLDWRLATAIASGGLLFGALVAFAWLGASQPMP